MKPHPFAAEALAALVFYLLAASCLILACFSSLWWALFDVMAYFIGMISAHGHAKRAWYLFRDGQ
jgi:hypothetical protein